MIFPASGTGAWEAALVNTLSPGDPVLMFETGHFATLWLTMAKRLGATYTVIEGAGHSPAVDDPVTSADVLCDFWKRAELLTT